MLFEFSSSSTSQPRFSQQRFGKRIFIQTIMGLIIPKGSNNLASKLSKLHLVYFISCALCTSFLKLNSIESSLQSHGILKLFDNPYLLEILILAWPLRRSPLSSTCCITLVRFSAISQRLVIIIHFRSLKPPAAIRCFNVSCKRKATLEFFSPVTTR